MTTPIRPSNLHTRAVRLAVVVLPVLALALLSTLFLLARKVNPDDAIPIASIDVSERARDRQLTAPRFAGISSEGTAFDLSAGTAHPDATDARRMTAQAVRLVLADTGGGKATVVADVGEIDTGGRSLILDGAVRIETANGYLLTTERLEGTLGQLDVVAPGEVTGDSPLGTLRAGSMRIDEDADGAARLLFTDGIVLLYEPPE